MAERDGSGVIGCVWEATAPPAPATQPCRGSHIVDVGIVGGGFSGICTALALRELGASVALLEARSIGWGASGRNNGLVIPALKQPEPYHTLEKFGRERGARLNALVRDSARLVFDTIRRLEIDCSAEQTGWIQPAHTPKHVAVAKRRYEQWASCGARVRFLDAAGVAALLGSNAYCGGWMAEDGGHINPLAYVRGLARAALHAGAKLFTNSPAQAIERRNHKWLVRGAQGSVSCEKLYLATAAYDSLLYPALRRSVLPIKFFQAATVPLDEAVRRGVLPGRQGFSDMRGDLYFGRYDSAQRYVSGGCFLFERGWRERLGPLTRKRLAEVFPSFAKVEFQYAWEGTAALTTDHFPHLHEPHPGLWSWIGCNARGIALSTAMGRVMADALLGKPEDVLPLPRKLLRTLPFHGLLWRLAPKALAYYRTRDAWDLLTSRRGPHAGEQR